MKLFNRLLKLLSVIAEMEAKAMVWDRRDSRGNGIWDRPGFRGCAALIALLFGAGIGARIINPAFANDQLEMLEFSRTWAWIYDEQMPLYAWISTALLRTFGETVIVLEALKLVFVSSAVVFIWKAADELQPGSGIFAVALAMVMPTVSDDALGEITHSAALLAFSAASVWMTIRVLDRDAGCRAITWLAMGAIWGAGVWFKHTMLLVAVAQSLVLLVHAHRSCDVRQSMGVFTAIAVMFLMIFPFYVITLFHAPIVTAGLEEFFQDRNVWLDALTSPLAEGGLLIVAASWSLFAHKTLPRTQSLLALSALVFVVVLTALVISYGADVIRDRWLAPGLLALVPAGASVAPVDRTWARHIAWGFVVIIIVNRAADTAFSV
jgi:hypothetical protein